MLKNVRAPVSDSATEHSFEFDQSVNSVIRETEREITRIKRERERERESLLLLRRGARKQLRGSTLGSCQLPLKILTKWMHEIC